MPETSNPSGERTLIQRGVDLFYNANLTVSMLAIGYDLTIQELVRERKRAWTLTLEPHLAVLHNNFVGDIGEAFAYVFVAPTVAEVINFGVQQSENISEGVKKVFEVGTQILPYCMAIFFLAAAFDGETAQHIFKWGTPDAGDLYGVTYGTAMALITALKFRNRVFPRGSSAC